MVLWLPPSAVSVPRLGFGLSWLTAPAALSCFARAAQLRVLATRAKSVTWRLVWAVDVRRRRLPWTFLVDAVSGKVVVDHGLDPRGSEQVSPRLGEDRITIVDEVRCVAQEAVLGIEEIAGHLQHPRLVRVDLDARDVHGAVRNSMTKKTNATRWWAAFATVLGARHRAVGQRGQSRR